MSKGDLEQNPLRLDLKAWFRAAAEGWKSPSRLRALAVGALTAALGDALTTSLALSSGFFREANPVLASAQESLGSVPLLMSLVTLPLLAAFFLLTHRPPGLMGRVLWSALATAAVLKFLVLFSNISLLVTLHLL